VKRQIVSEPLTRRLRAGDVPVLRDGAPVMIEVERHEEVDLGRMFPT
jgi:hypothetical protein